MATQAAVRTPTVLRAGTDTVAATRGSRPLRPKIAVVMPAHNEAGNIGITVPSVARTMANLDLDWETIVVDDGSTDRTAEVVAHLDASCRVSLLRLSRNFGKEAAITAGIDHAQGDAVLCMDADGQHPVDLIPLLLERWREGYDMVYAVRDDRHKESLFKRVAARIFYRLLRQTGEIDVPADAGDFRWMDRCVIAALRNLPERTRFMKGLYSWVGFRSIGVPYTPLARVNGQSSFSSLKLARLAWSGITSFSVWPLRAASVVGGLLATCALAYGAYELLQSLWFGTDVPGWPTVVVGMMFLSGVQLLFIGILGEYLARVYDEVKGRPSYIVAEYLPLDEVRARNRVPTREHVAG